MSIGWEFDRMKSTGEGGKMTNISFYCIAVRWERAVQPAAADGIGDDSRILAMSGLLMSPTSRPTNDCHLLTHLTAIAALCGERYTSSVKHGTELI